MNPFCKHCGKAFFPCASVPHQQYCSNHECQRARKRIWQKQKLGKDPDYCENQNASQKAWRARHTEYMREYRKRSPGYAERNRSQQRERNNRLRNRSPSPPSLPEKSSSLIVKMDELHAGLANILSPCRSLRVELGFIVKIDELYRHFRLDSGLFVRSPLLSFDCKEMTSSLIGQQLIRL